MFLLLTQNTAKEGLVRAVAFYRDRAGSPYSASSGSTWRTFDHIAGIGSERNTHKKENFPRENPRFYPIADEIRKDKGQSDPGPPIGNPTPLIFIAALQARVGVKEDEVSKEKHKAHADYDVINGTIEKDKLPSIICTSFGNVYLTAAENSSCWKATIKEEMNNKGEALIMTSADPFPNKENSCPEKNGFHSFTKLSDQH